MVLYLLLMFEGLASGSENGGDDNHWDGETKEAIQCYFTYIVVQIVVTNRIRRPPLPCQCSYKICIKTCQDLILHTTYL